MIRQRKKTGFSGADVVRSLDSFSKFSKEDYVKRTRIGGVVTLFATIFIIWILISEVRYYLKSRVDYTFVPHGVNNDTLKVNLDITVATPCQYLSPKVYDVLSNDDSEPSRDSEGSLVLPSGGGIRKKDTWFEMSPEHRSSFEDLRHLNSYLSEEYHSISDLLWKSGHAFMHPGFSERESVPARDTDACQLYGSLELNRLSGVLDIIFGMPTNHDGHAHFHPAPEGRVNFSHRIHHFSFGDSRVGIINPLDGDEKVTSNNHVSYIYFIEVVPTEVDTLLSKAKTYQYSVKELTKVKPSVLGPHLRGITFKYDFCALKVIVRESYESPIPFLMRLSSTLAGIFIVAGLVKDSLQYLWETYGLPPPTLDPKMKPQPPSL